MQMRKSKSWSNSGRKIIILANNSKGNAFFLWAKAVSFEILDKVINTPSTILSALLFLISF